MVHPCIPLHNVAVEDTTRCPLATSCDLCGALDELVLTTAITFAGVCCVSVCPDCDDADDLPGRRPLDVLDACAHHAEHLGIDLDQLMVLSVAFR